MTNSLPTYQNLFGTDNYYTVPDSRSVLSPAAYLVELLKLVENNIQGQNLKARRPDIYNLLLDNNNTVNELSKLEIVNKILGESIGVVNPATATYPFNLPYNKSLEEVRHYLAQSKTTLQGIWKTFNEGYQGDPDVSKSIFLETIGISLEQWSQYSTDPVLDGLWQFYGYPSGTTDAEVVINLTDVQTFLSKTGLTQKLLCELIYGDLSDDEVSAGTFQQNFYINGSTPNTPIEIQGQILANLTPINAARVMRFVRMARAIGWSFTDFDWALQTIRTLVESRDEALPYLAWIQEQINQNGLTVNQCCGFLGQIKNFGKKNGPCFYDILFNNPSNASLPSIPFTWNVPRAGIVSAAVDKQIESALSAALQLCQSDLLKAVAPIVQYVNSNSYSLTINSTNLALLYRMSLLPRILNNTLSNIFLASKILSQKIGLTYCLRHNDYPVGNVLNIIDPTSNQPLFTGQIVSITPQQAESFTTYTIVVSGNGNNIQLVLDGSAQAFSSLTIGTTQVKGLTAENVDQYVYTGLLINNLLVSASEPYASALYALSHLTKLFSWLNSVPLNLGQLEFITLGESSDSTIQNSIISTDAAQNFINQLGSSIKKELLNESSLYSAIVNNVVQLYSTLVLSNSFRRLIAQPNVLLSNVAEFCKWIILGNAQKPPVISINNALQSENLITGNGIVINNLDQKALEGKIISIIENTFTNTINEIAEINLSSQEVFSASGSSPEVITQVTALAGNLTQFILSSYVRQQQALVHNLSGLYRTPTSVTKALLKWGDINLTEILGSATPIKNPPLSLLDAMLSKNSQKDVPNENIIIQALQKLQQTAVLITSFSLSPAETTFFKTIYIPTSLFPISFHSVKEIWKFKQLVKAYNDSQNNLLNIIENPGTQDWLTKLAKLTNWNIDDLTIISSSSYLNITSPSINDFDLLNKYFTTSKLIGIKVTAVWNLVQLSSELAAISSISLEITTTNTFVSISINDNNESSITQANVNEYVTVAAGSTSANPLMSELSPADSLVGSFLTIQNPSGGNNLPLAAGIITEIYKSTSGPNITYTFSLNPLYESAVNLWAGINAQYEDSPATLTKIQNKLNEKLRDKLVPLAGYNLTSELNNYGNGARGLYAYLLIDVEITGAIQTTKIREAISAVQLYIYRCLNQLEPATTLKQGAMLPALWQWMQSYREWQANMEVFLYPENYIEPELRAEKTDLFSKAEHALKQANLANPENVETIFRDYMNGFEEIGNLQVISCAARTYTNEDAEGTQNFKELCMIGVGPSGHGQYYYRLSKFRESVSQGQYVPYDWGQWKKITITMNTVEYQPGQYGIPKPIFAFGRWYIFWVEQQKYNTINDSSSTPQTTYKYYSGTINLTYLDFNGNWTLPQTILKVDIDRTPITPVTVNTTSPTTTTTSYIISTKHEAEVQWFYPDESIDNLSFKAFQMNYTYKQSYISNIEIECLQFFRGSTLMGTSAGLYILNESKCQLWPSSFNLKVLCLGVNVNQIDYCYIGTSAGLYSTVLGNPPSLMNVPDIPSTVLVQCICNTENDSKNDWLVGTSSGLYYFKFPGLHFHLSNNGIPGDANVISVAYDKTYKYWYAGTPTGLYVSSDPSSEWTSVEGIPSGVRINCVQYLDTATNAGTPNGIYAGNGLTGWGPAISSKLNVLCFGPNYSPYYAGTSTGLYQYGSGPWSQVPGIPNTVSVQCICTDDGTNWLAGTSAGLYVSVKNGAWTLVTGIPGDANISCASFDGGNNWYAGTFFALYTTTSANFPNDWTLVSLLYSKSQPAIPLSTIYSNCSNALFIQGESNWFIVNGQKAQYLNVSYPPGDTPTNFNVYRLNSTAIPDLGTLLNAPNGIDELLMIPTQETPESHFENLGPVNTYVPNINYPLDAIDFSNKNAMRMYYWELFFHLPFLIANELNQQQHFAHAKLWYEYIFNPRITKSNDQTYNRYWRFLGLRTDGRDPNQTLANELVEGEMAELRNDLHNAIQLYASESKPFDPQVIAQLRPIAYQKTIVMHYISNLLNWGDMLYTENTRDSINEAEMLYVLAYNLLGEQPKDLGPEALADTTSYNCITQPKWTQMTANQFPLAADVTCLKGYEGVIYIGTQINGLWMHSDNSLIQVTQNGFPINANICCIERCDNVIYIGTVSQGLWAYSNNAWTQIKDNGFPINDNISCVKNYNEVIYLGTQGNGLWACINNSWVQINGNGFSTNAYICCLENYYDTMYIGTSTNGLWNYSDNSFSQVTGNGFPQNASIVSIKDYNGIIYIGTRQNGLWTYVNNSYVQITGNGFPENDCISDIGFFDGVIYVGAYSSGLWTCSNNIWTELASNEFINNSRINCIGYYNSVVYVGTTATGLWSYSNNIWAQIVSNEFPQDSCINHITEYHGNVYIGTGSSGLWCKYPYYFGIPRSQQFLNYWDEVKQRIYNIRHGLTITGQTDNLPLFSPPINPMDMVEAVGSGESVAEAMQLLNSNIPYYRFEVMIEKAKEFTGAVVGFGQSLLSALQTKDAQKLAELYNKNERHILNITQAVKQDNLQYAQQTLTSLQQGLINAQNRQTHYSGLINEGWLPGETAQVALAGTAIGVAVPAEAIRIASIVGYSIPTIFGFSDGGFHPGSAIVQGAEMLQGVSNILDQSSSLAGTIAGYQRRAQDWGLQAQLAQDDVNQINYQIVAAQYQLDLAQQDINVLQKQIAQQHKVAEFYKTKFTNEQLYSWYIGQLSALYFQAYQLAHEMALQTENAWKFEHIGLPFSDQKDNFIQSGYWNSLYEGLLSGESLQLDLLRMEKAFMNQNVRRFEISKTVSLAKLDPIALNNLITTGSCQFDITENDFAWDYPGHYCRKIKTVSVSIPMVVGPYQNIHATLTQTSSKIINSDGSDGVNAVKYLLNPKSNPLTGLNAALQANLIPNQQIALSQGVDDTGMFQLNFADARYLPFEGTGAVSSWQLDLPISENAINYSSITDVIIQINYNALPASSSYEEEVRLNRGNKQARNVIKINNPSSGITFPINPGTWAGVTSKSKIQISKVAMVIQSQAPVHTSTIVTISETNIGAISFSQWKYNWAFGSVNNFNIALSQQTLTLTVTGELPNSINDILLVIDYEVSDN